MPILDGIKFACKACINGHRTSSCQHKDRELHEIKKKGRPVSQCEHCRTKRKTDHLHTKCTCSAFLPKKKRKKAKSMEGIVTNSVSPPSELDVVTSPDPLRVDSLLNPCDCQSGNPCVCCRTDPDKVNGVQERNPGCHCPPGGCQAFSDNGCPGRRPPEAGAACCGTSSSRNIPISSHPASSYTSPWQLATPASNLFGEMYQDFGNPTPVALNGQPNFAHTTYSATTLIGDAIYESHANDGITFQPPLYEAPKPTNQRDSLFVAHENSQPSYPQPEAPKVKSCCSEETRSIPTGALHTPIPDSTRSSNQPSRSTSWIGYKVDDDDVANFPGGPFVVPPTPEDTPTSLRNIASFRDPFDEEIRSLRLLTSVYASVGTCGGGGSCCGGVSCTCAAGICQCGSGSPCDAPNKPRPAADTSSWNSSTVMNMT